MTERKPGETFEDSYGEKMVRRADASRETVGWVSRHHGAYLLSWGGPLSDDMPENEKYDCASSLALAKRLLRAGAIDMGYQGPLRWTRERDGLWSLEATYVDEYDRYVDDDD